MDPKESIFLVGINHINAPLSSRERAVVVKDETLAILQYLKSYARLDEIVLLSTCSRVEIIGAAPDLKSSELIYSWLSRRAGERATSSIYIKQGDEAIGHLFRVASGLDSWILGESEILAQFKEAYHFALEQAMTGRLLNRVLQKAIAAGKSVRSATGIQNGIRSIGGAAAMLANRIFGDLKNGQIIVFGAGQAAESVAKHLAAKDFKRILIANRHQDRAQALADSLGAGILSLEEGLRKLPEADAAIFSLASSKPALTAGDLKTLLRGRAKPLFLIDLGVPRNVESECVKLEGVYLYNLDDLKGLVERNIEKRSSQKAEAERLASDLAKECGGELAKPVVPASKVLAAFVFAFWALSPAWSQEAKFSQEQMKARFYYDLGPAQIDVSSYPKDQQASYAVFVRACSQCHSLARPINSVIVGSQDWERFIRRMYAKSKTSSKLAISKKDARIIVDFLAFDSKIRKIEHKEEFEVITRGLKQLFEELQKEKARIKLEEGKKIKPSSSYTGERP